MLPNPVGYNRVYVQVGPELTYDAWWQGLKAGRSFVTNGPLLLVKADEQLPGHVFTAAEGGKVAVRLDVRVLGSAPLSAVEIVKNGQVVEKILPEQLASGASPTVSFDRSGWFLVRAMADVPHTFRFASTAPFYVEIGESKKRISRSSVQFFLDWLAERAARVPAKLQDPKQLAEVLEYHQAARQFWQQLLATANAD